MKTLLSNSLQLNNAHKLHHKHSPYQFISISTAVATGLTLIPEVEVTRALFFCPYLTLEYHDLNPSRKHNIFHTHTGHIPRMPHYI